MVTDVASRNVKPLFFDPMRTLGRTDGDSTGPSKRFDTPRTGMGSQCGGERRREAGGEPGVAWKTAKKNARVAVRWHDLRHTAVTRLLESGQTLPMIASIMGWSASTTVRMAQRYGHISTDARRVAMEAMNGPRLKLLAVEANAAEKQGAVH
jgi:hypothetical protein